MYTWRILSLKTTKPMKVKIQNRLNLGTIYLTYIIQFERTVCVENSYIRSFSQQESYIAMTIDSDPINSWFFSLVVLRLPACLSVNFYNLICIYSIELLTTKYHYLMNSIRSDKYLSCSKNTGISYQSTVRFENVKTVI